jgi:diaminohydroxyphosphoribosylaminopyrimidine deaminase/5-amino-6-(5-phosphoribosylamino)uracil reductase
MSSHEYYMSRALQFAEQGLFTTDPNPRVGCILVKNGQIIGQGWHQYSGEGHAEVHALKDAGLNAKGADCYVTLEPCSHFGRTAPCADAIINSGVKRVFIAMTDPNPLVSGSGINKLKLAGIEVIVGILEQQAEVLNIGFCKRMRTGLPYVRSKMAMSMDGRTAMASGESNWITGPAARQDVHKLRAQSSAILTGIGTVLADDPALTVRPEAWYPVQTIRQPKCIVVDSKLRINEDAKILKDNAQVLIVTTVANKTFQKAEVCCLPADNDQVDLGALMAELGRRQMNEIMVEAGSKLNGALLAAGLIDELVIYMAPKIMGDGAKGLFHLPALSTMAQNIHLQITDIRAVGCDWRITALPQLNKDH